MRLIDTATHQLAGPFIGSDIPRYAILSHTWSQEELSLQDMSHFHRHREKRGYRKIRSCCERARKDAYNYIWVDTVCIDKTSSAELSEAINSMYKWYSKAKVCYAFLEDLETDQTSVSFDSDLRKCRWFTRGWTLQELIAPKRLIFFNKNWVEVGDKGSLVKKLIEITGIDGLTLNAPQTFQRLSVANRMSWASRRKTTRPEDEAYCLLGIFDINIPLLYGEGGERAFLRLQEEIIRKTGDQSIFAWSQEEACGVETDKFWGLLAPTPSFFMNSSQYVPIRKSQHSDDIAMSPRGITLMVAIDNEERVIALNCRKRGTLGFFSVLVSRLQTGQNHYVREKYPSATISEDIWKTFNHVKITVPTYAYRLNSLTDNLINDITFTALPSEHEIDDFYPIWSYDRDAKTLCTPPFTSGWTYGTVFLFRQTNRDSLGFLLCLFGNNERETSAIRGHFVYVFDNPTQKSPLRFYQEDFAPWFTDESETILANAANPSRTQWDQCMEAE